MQKEDQIYKLRHSCAHVLAQAVVEMFPEAKLAIGPPIDTGFYYDFELPRTLIPEDLKLIEKKMKNIIKQNQTFEQRSLPIDKGIKFLQETGQFYKEEMAMDLKEKGEVELSFYENFRPNNKEHGLFVDMCEGPHVEKTKEIRAFKLLSTSGAYWKGDEKNKMLQRIYGACFETREELDNYLKMLEEAKKRDHRKLGAKLKLFTISPLIGAGLPLMQPRGMVLRKLIEDWLWELHKDKGYERVWSPHIAKMELYETSGHAAKFGDELFNVKGKEDEFVLKPMNCPHHMQIYSDNLFSYRDMPIRYFEPATVYRDEKSGQLSGLTRVRAITQDDGHLFCRVSQITEEVQIVTSIIKEFYSTLGMTDDYWVSLSVRGEDKSIYLGGDDVWEKAENALEEAAKKSDLPYKKIEGEAAFYGPKLDFMFKDCIGREWQLATIQCDFNLPERFDLSYVNEEGEKERPVVIHRAISGSLERFMGIIIEHFAGLFPLWLAPIQMRVIPISKAQDEGAQNFLKQLKDVGIRAEIDLSNDSFSKKIRNGELERIPYLLIIGDKEIESNAVAVRNVKTKKQEVIDFHTFVKDSLVKIEGKEL